MSGIKPDQEHLVALALSGALPDAQSLEVLRAAFPRRTPAGEAAADQPAPVSIGRDLPFGYLVCGIDNNDSSEFVYRQVWDNLTPQDRAQHVVKSTLFDAPCRSPQS